MDESGRAHHDGRCARGRVELSCEALTVVPVVATGGIGEAGGRCSAGCRRRGLVRDDADRRSKRWSRHSRRTVPIQRSANAFALGAPDRDADHPGADGAPHVVEGPGELGVAVADQVSDDAPGLLQFACEVAGMLGDPLAGRVGRDAAQVHPSRLDLDEEQDVVAGQPVGCNSRSCTGASAT